MPRVFVGSSICFILMFAASSHAGNVFGVFMGQNIHAAREVFTIRYNDYLEVGLLTNGPYASPSGVSSGVHFGVDGDAGFVSADDLSRVKTIYFRSKLLEKIAGFSLPDTRIVSAWMEEQLQLPSQSFLKVSNAALEPYEYEYRFIGPSAFVVKVFADRSVYFQATKPNRLKSIN